MNCTACGSSDVDPVGLFRPYLDYECEIFDCDACGSRFTLHVPMHDVLHRGSSRYLQQEALAAATAEALVGDDLPRAAKLLASTPKFAFLLSVVDGLPRGSRVLEVGCSTGYLTAYLRAAGLDAIGADVSEFALEAATRRFGRHYVQVGDPRISEKAPYRAIIHAGTIGCVPDPVSLTREHLSMLEARGVLAFNAPNVEVCRPRGLWGSTTPPPDLVTLFAPRFWEHTFGKDAEVEVIVAPSSAVERLKARIVPSRVWREPREPSGVLADRDAGDALRGGRAAALGRWRRAAMMRLAGLADRLGLLPSTPGEFGVYVTMRRGPVLPGGPGNG